MLGGSTDKVKEHFFQYEIGRAHKTNQRSNRRIQLRPRLISSRSNLSKFNQGKVAELKTVVALDAKNTENT